MGHSNPLGLTSRLRPARVNWVLAGPLAKQSKQFTYLEPAPSRLDWSEPGPKTVHETFFFLLLFFMQYMEYLSQIILGLHHWLFSAFFDARKVTIKGA